MSAVAKSGETISFCRVSAHFQNGTAEKPIRDLSEQAREHLLHAKARWPSAIEINLWPYALRNANDIRNTIADKDDGSSPLERFCRTEVRPKLRHNHTFGCPIFALNSRLQDGKAIPKWNPRARLGINLRHSPPHARSVNLVLKLNTGLVSPQFHVQYDDFFETVRPSSGNEHTFSQWQYIFGLVNRRAREQTQPSEGAEDPFDTSPSIPTNESHPEEANLDLQVDTDKFSPVDDNIDTQDSHDLPEETQEGPPQEQPAETSGTPNVSRYGRVR
jgi:hypothetical protein